MANDSPAARGEHDGTPISELQGHERAATTPLLRSLTLWGLGLACAAIWLSLLLATDFNGVVVALGLLVSLAVLN